MDCKKYIVLRHIQKKLNKNVKDIITTIDNILTGFNFMMDWIEGRIIGMIQDSQSFGKSSLMIKDPSKRCCPVRINRYETSMINLMDDGHLIYNCREFPDLNRVAVGTVFIYKCCERHQFILESNINAIIRFTLSYDENNVKNYMNIVQIKDFSV